MPNKINTIPGIIVINLWNVFSKDSGVKISFSNKTKIVRATTKYKFITPATNNIAIKNQQQNTQ